MQSSKGPLPHFKLSFGLRVSIKIRTLPLTSPFNGQRGSSKARAEKNVETEMWSSRFVIWPFYDAVTESPSVIPAAGA
ncbi:hypothetical protein GWI33_015408 [Rhynchophorus ferrugineus]|uniref:Uncharacterized protein n=1 Tax=Rhynchophorus ferrugineus TaxID=354439 RepID=A0A834MBG4_RHYFE|nr:hypothetical protein GWI33_015408 [Rhynchophorus ferrugineus]